MTQQEIEGAIVKLLAEWEKLHSGEEMIVITLPKHDPEERKRIIKRLSEML